MNKFISFLLISTISICGTIASAKESAVHVAVRTNSIDTVEFLVKEKGDVNSQDQFGYSPLHLAVRYENDTIVDFLLKSGANLDVEDNFGDTPLLDAVRNNNTNIAKKLICKKASRDIHDKDDLSALYYATKNNNLELMKLLTVDYVELYCQSEIKISINKLQENSEQFCGKIDKGYVSNMTLDMVDDEQKTYGPYSVKFNNESHTWCADINENVPTNRYLVTVKANDYVVNNAMASINTGVATIKIKIDELSEAVDSSTPNICGTILNADASKIDLSISKDEELLGVYSAKIDNENKTWCAKVENKLSQGTYQLTANGEDNNNNKSTAKSSLEIKPSIAIDIDPIPLYNDNTPEICGRVLKGDISSLQLSLKSSTGIESALYEAKIDSQSQTWCANVTDELGNGTYEITAIAHNVDNEEASDMQSTKIYVITGLYEALKEEFKDDFSKWNAELDKDTLTFRFKDPSLLFNPGRSNINNNFEVILKDFFPRYVKVVQEYKDQIKNVRVEGHSSSEHSKARNDEERFELNQKLSQARAQAVLDYAIALGDNMILSNLVWIETTFEPIGMSYSKLIYNLDGSENKKLSRRVEFKIETKDQELMQSETLSQNEMEELTQEEIVNEVEPIEDTNVEEKQDDSNVENIDDTMSELEELELESN